MSMKKSAWLALNTLLLTEAVEVEVVVAVEVVVEEVVVEEVGVVATVRC
jgi:hypothetical protein